MSNFAPVRKSGRQRVPNRKYVEAGNAFQQMNNILNDDDSEIEAEPEDLLEGSSAEKDSEFSAELTAQDPDQESAESNSTKNVSDGSDIATPVEDLEPIHSYDSHEFKVHRQNLRGKRNQPMATNSNTRSRGLTEQQMKNHEDRITLLAGPEEAEELALQNTRAQWTNDPCLPRRERMRHAFAHTEEQRVMEAEEGWDWYWNHGGREAFAKKQSVTNLSIEARTKYLTGPSQDLLMGPYGNQKLFNLPHLQHLPIDGFSDDSSVDPMEELDANQQSSRKRIRHGWMLNAGSKIKCLDWAPNRDGKIQYLALASSASSNHSTKGPSETAPAFTPCQSTPSSIQVWALSTIDPLDTNSALDTSAAPKLKQILCSNWGDAKQLKWCPMPRDDRLQKSPRRTSIGLLAGIWGDGFTRVLDVQSNSQDKDTTKYLKVDSAAFTARPPNTICTCVCWLSPTDLAIGHSDGSITVYDIYPTPAGDTVTTTPPLVDTDTAPQVTCSYITIPDPRSTFSPILTLTSAYPTHPTLLATSSISGYERLLDLRAPMTDYVLGIRTRSPSTNLVYSPHLHSFVYNDESEGTIRASGLRCWGVDRVRFARTFKGGRKGGASRAGPLGRGCLDVGKVHSCVALGAADGSVLVSNPVRAVLGMRRDKPEYWQMCVCRLEWVRRRASSAIETTSRLMSSRERDDAGLDAGGDVEMASADGEDTTKPMGISRITQSYKAEKLDFVTGRTEKPAYATIYEEENAVTAVSWNPNLSCGGWLAVGWGCGLVRVEDVAI